MSQKRATQRRWMVHRKFEPDRLSPATLVQAYAHLVPPHIRVLRLPTAVSEAAGAAHEQKQAQPNNPVVLKMIELAEYKPQAKQSLVIGSITKKEAA